MKYRRTRKRKVKGVPVLKSYPKLLCTRTGGFKIYGKPLRIPFFISKPLTAFDSMTAFGMVIYNENNEIIDPRNCMINPTHTNHLTAGQP